MKKNPRLNGYTVTTTRKGKVTNKYFPVGSIDSSQYERQLQNDGLWKITKHSDSYLNAMRLAEKYNEQKSN